MSLLRVNVPSLSQEPPPPATPSRMSSEGNMSCSAYESVIASPKTMRSTSASERRPFAPVTPQRNGRANRMRVASSPLTPSNSNSSVISSPFTPITNVYSSSSSFVSPDSSVSTKVGSSPEYLKLRQKSIADATHNWRSRAKENGIKVDSDEISYADTLALNSFNDSVPASFLSTHRRPRQALFQANSADGTAFISPKTARISAHDGAVTVPVPSSLASSLLNTPESGQSQSSSFSLTTPSPRSSLAIVQRLRQRGSVTDPARPRRRHISGPIFVRLTIDFYSIHVFKAPLQGETLFDIDEDAPFSAPIPGTFGSPITLRKNNDTFTATKRSVSAPFIAARFYGGGVDEDEDDEFEDDGLPAAPKRSRARTQSVPSLPTIASVSDVTIQENLAENMCSVCSATSSPLSVLVPCEHLICSSCLTSSLNIVGEKDMRCATCDKSVEDFRLLSPLKIDAQTIEETERCNTNSDLAIIRDEPMNQLLPSAIENLSLVDSDGKKQTCSDQAMQNKGAAPVVSPITKDNSNLAVLRIDNVPWDVTPASLSEFFSPHAVVRAHVLLDSKGKTLSHAYVEVPASDARNALRNVQNKSLGKGRRLRGVTVTLSGQAELMRALFPSWLGSFDGSHPTLDGLDHPSMIRTLENGLITLPEIDSLLALMKNPKSHFLKVPTLPFYLLASVLSKFPIEGDSRVFWSANLRNVLYELATAACDLLVGRIQSEYHDQHALETIVSTTVNCRLFTDIQRRGLFERVLKAVSSKGGEIACATPDIASAATTMSPQSDELILDDELSSLSASTASIRSGSNSRGPHYGNLAGLRQNAAPFSYNGAVPYGTSLQATLSGLASPQMMNTPLGLRFSNPTMSAGMQFPSRGPMKAPYDILAREFNVDPDLVAALAQRLAYAGQTLPPQGLGSFGYVNGRM
ncbi:uncharacterized protein FOMMEDRAFT_165895 [Fomitiporia mediterranea MF3/22]|uniref:uncharacterized protein n=1 Tax=Fomitiporia mediterranea (strain MF3/22) TaxID=694068 RepID=UPI00044087D9|nr:uncharacterized protein FOMMEDRAFT_165895 [Fomitiporia mediterranea MF3/22]EJD05485.1 hypothetical protein FOMMEDRAFT_165895 [Fomitiporia mediterranea MF3/22]